MLKLLCIIGNVYPPRTGGDQAVFNALKLLQKYVNLHIFVVEKINIDRYKEVLTDCTISFFDQSKRDRYETIHQIALRFKKILQKIGHVENSAKERELELTVNLERNANLYLAINRYIKANKIDIVQLEFGTSLFWAEGIVEQVKKVYVQHEIQYVVHEQRLPQSANAMQKMHLGIEKNREIAMMNAYNAVITLSESDKQKLIKDGVKVPIYASFAKTQSREYSSNYNNIKDINLVFVGPEAHTPNINGLKWFLDKVWELILLQHPNIQLHIIGQWKNKTKSNWELKYKNIFFDGFVNDLGSAMRNNILIVPIREGSGIRMKILEAASIGITFVSCTVGVEGLGFENGKNCFVTDDPNIFADDINYLLSNHLCLHKLSEAAYRYAKETFSDERFINSRLLCYKNI